METYVCRQMLFIFKAYLVSEYWIDSKAYSLQANELEKKKIYM